MMGQAKKRMSAPIGIGQPRFEKRLTV